MDICFDDFLCESQSDEYASRYEDWADDFYDDDCWDFLDDYDCDED